MLEVLLLETSIVRISPCIEPPASHPHQLGEGSTLTQDGFPAGQRGTLLTRVLVQNASTGPGRRRHVPATSRERGDVLVKVICPECSSFHSKRAPRHGGQDFLRRLFGWFPWRCWVCHHRFYVRRRL